MSNKINESIDKHLSESELKSYYFGKLSTGTVIEGDEEQLESKLFLLERIPRTSCMGHVVFDLCRQEIVLVSSDHKLYVEDISNSVKQIDFVTLEQAVHTDDIELCRNLHRAIANLLDKSYWSLDDKVRYFSYRLRMHSIIEKPNKSKFCYLLLIPIPTNGRIRYLLSMIYSAAVASSGDLRLYYHDNSYDEWQQSKDIWIHRKPEKITLREKDILQLAKAGLKTKEIADELHISTSTVSNIEFELYRRWDVNNMHAAVLYASNRNLIP